MNSIHGGFKESGLEFVEHKKASAHFWNATAHLVINTVAQHCLDHCVSLDLVKNVMFFLKSNYPLMRAKSGIHSARGKVLWTSKHLPKPMFSYSRLQERHAFIATCTILERKVEPWRSTVTHISPLEYAYALDLYIKIMLFSTRLIQIVSCSIRGLQSGGRCLFYLPWGYATVADGYSYLHFFYSLLFLCSSLKALDRNTAAWEPHMQTPVFTTISSTLPQKAQINMQHLFQGT